MVVKELMTSGVVTVEPNSSAALAARLLARHNVGALPVCGPDGRLRGMVTDRDDPAQTPVKDIMSRGCAFAAPDMDCAQAGALMARSQVRRLPVVEGGRVVGILALSDLARCGQYDMEAAQALSEISDNVVFR